MVETFSMASPNRATDRRRPSIVGAWWVTISSSASVWLQEAVEVVLDLARGAQRGVGEHLVHLGCGPGGEQLVGLLVGHVEVFDADLPSVEADGSSAPDVLQLRLGIAGGVGGDDVDPGDHVGSLQLFGGPELASVGGDRRVQRRWREVRRERVGQAKRRGQLRAEQ